MESDRGLLVQRRFVGATNIRKSRIFSGTLFSVKAVDSSIIIVVFVVFVVFIVVIVIRLRVFRDRTEVGLGPPALVVGRERREGGVSRAGGGVNGCAAIEAITISTTTITISTTTITSTTSTSTRVSVGDRKCADRDRDIDRDRG